MQQLLAISHYTLLEARRARLLLLFAAALGAVSSLAFFVSELAVIESLRMQATFYAAGARLAAVFIVAVHVIGSVTREFDDKGLDALLALDLPRSHYILGKLGGFLMMGVVVGAIACLPLLWMAPVAGTAQWGLALALELSVVIAFALFCVITFGQFMPSAALVLAFYVLARSLTAIRLMSANPVSGADTLSHEIGRWMIEGLALITPALDRWPQITWLIDAPASWHAVLMLLLEAALYVALLAGAAMVDFHRRNF
jgi:ABC-type transport system involved in multi-copper enzyme maturation permease subunit